MGEMLSAFGKTQDAKEWSERAMGLKRRFAEQFFDDELGCYILALDGEKQCCRVVSSNAGHTLLTGIASKAHAEAIADRLLESDCFTGWGIRTLASGEKRYLGELMLREKLISAKELEKALVLLHERRKGLA